MARLAFSPLPIAMLLAIGRRKRFDHGATNNSQISSEEPNLAAFAWRTFDLVLGVTKNA